MMITPQFTAHPRHSPEFQTQICSLCLIYISIWMSNHYLKLSVPPIPNMLTKSKSSQFQLIATFSSWISIKPWNYLTFLLTPHIFPVSKFYWFYLLNISRISPHLPASTAPSFCKAALISQISDSNSFLKKKVYASTFTPTVSSLVSTSAMTCRFLSQNFPLSSSPIRVQAVIFGET